MNGVIRRDFSELPKYIFTRGSNRKKTAVEMKISSRFDWKRSPKLNDLAVYFKMGGSMSK